MFKELQAADYVRYDDVPLETRRGRLIDVEFVSNIYLSGTHWVIQCNIRDITERRTAERARQTSDERYRALFNYAPDGIVTADRDGRFLDANSSVCRMRDAGVEPGLNVIYMSGSQSPEGTRTRSSIRVRQGV